MILQGPKTRLRPFVATDLDDIFLVLSNPEVMRYSLSGPHSREGAEKFLAWCDSQYRQRGHGLFAVTCPPDLKVVGYCGYYHHELDGVPEVEIGYRLHPDYWGRGLATESASLVRDFGFSTLGFPRLISIIDPGNVRSIRVAERIGMTFLRYHLFRGEVPTSLYGMAAPGLKLS